MKKDHVSKLMQRYLKAQKTGIYPYFDADEIDNMLERLEQKGNYKHYEALLHLGKNLHPGNTNLAIRQCKFHIHTKGFTQALVILDMAAASIEVEALRLECYARLNASDKVLNRIESLIISKCEYLEELLEYIIPLLNDISMSDLSLKIINRTLPLFPENYLLIDELSYIYEIKGDYEHAIKALNKVIDNNPHSSDNWYNMGRLHSIMNNHAEAIEAFEFSLACATNKELEHNDDLKAYLAYSFFMNENYEKAVEIYTQMQELPDKTINVYIKTMIAECYAQLEDFEKAFQALQSIIDNNTNDSHTYMNYVRCSMETDRRQEASRILRRTANLLPDELRPLTDIAINLLEIGNTNQALSITDKIIKYIDEEDSKDYYIDENTDLLAKHPKTCKYFFFQTPLPVKKLVYAYLNDNGCRN